MWILLIVATTVIVLGRLALRAYRANEAVAEQLSSPAYWMDPEKERSAALLAHR